MKLDMSDKAKHYRVYPIESVNIIDGNGLNYFQGNALKYITRWRHKVDPKGDLVKCKQQIEWEIERIQHIGFCRKWLISLWLCYFRRPTYPTELVMRENNYPTGMEREIVKALITQTVSLRRKYEMLYSALRCIAGLKRSNIVTGG